MEETEEVIGKSPSNPQHRRYVANIENSIYRFLFLFIFTTSITYPYRLRVVVTSSYTAVFIFKEGEKPHAHFWHTKQVGRKSHDKSNIHPLNDRDKRIMNKALEYNNKKNNG